MTRDELLDFHIKVCEDARALMNLKNRDYAGGGGEQPFANFTRCEAMGICETEAGFLVRVIDKVSRMSSFLRAGKMHVEDESFYDAIIDVVNYMVLLGAYVKDKDSELTMENHLKNIPPIPPIVPEEFKDKFNSPEEWNFGDKTEVTHHQV